ncbi:MAG: ATP-binding protein [Nocardioidaceae bacterium]|nr:ATP-binding protein [Nocardioidaceae bacterium]MDQ3164933.1 ATP-binding protein [Actinomycetota bacterium]
MVPSASTVTLTIKPDLSHVRLVRLVAVTLGRLNGIGEDVLDDVRLATGEACSRAVASHLHHGLAQPVEVELRGGDGLDVCVRDFVPLPPATGESAAEVLRQDMVEQQSALPEAIGLIEGVSDDVTVHTGEMGTTVEMRWSRA